MTRFVLTVAFGLTLAIALLLTVGACAESSQTEPTPAPQAPIRMLGSGPRLLRCGVVGGDDRVG